NPAIKSLNYLNNVLAKIEANNAGCEEAVMLNAEGFVAECTGDNIFIVKAGQLLTPPLSAGALYGITRGVVMDLAREEGVTVQEPSLTRHDLFNADECFLTGTGAELIPIVKIDGRVIGTGLPAPLRTSNARRAVLPRPILKRPDDSAARIVTRRLPRDWKGCSSPCTKGPGTSAKSPNNCSSIKIMLKN